MLCAVTVRDKDEMMGEQVGSATVNSQKVVEGPATASCRNYQAVNLPKKIVNNNDLMGQPWHVAYGSYGVWAVADCTNHCVYICV